MKEKVSKKNKRSMSAALRVYLIRGFFTAIPLVVTVFVLNFLFQLVGNIGQPFVNWLVEQWQDQAPEITKWLKNPYFQNILAAIIILAGLCGLGLFATRVLGQRMINLFDRLMDKIPFVKTVYGSVKKLLEVVQQRPDDLQRVVLIDFPSPEMKTVGFVTRTLTDADTGKELVAVYVPTTPNPTSGYLEIVPKEKVISTTWTVDEAMTFIMSGGAIAPPKMNYEKSALSNKEI